jgi:hypothetical protein
MGALVKKDWIGILANYIFTGAVAYEGVNYIYKRWQL